MSRKQPKVNIIPFDQYKKTGITVKPIIYKKPYNEAVEIQKRIKKTHGDERTFIATEQGTQTKPTHSDSKSMSLQSLFLKANEIKNQSTNDLIKLKDLDLSNDLFKSLNQQKAVLDKLVNSYIEKINGLRMRRGNYTNLDKSELSLLPSKLQTIELEYSKIKDMINEYLKEENVSPEEKAKRLAARLQQKLIEMNQYLDPVTNEKKLRAEIQSGPDIENIARQLNDSNVRQKIVEEFEERMNEFNSEYQKLSDEINKMMKEVDSIDESVYKVTFKGNLFKELEKMDILIHNLKRKQDEIMKKIKTNIEPIDIITFEINMDSIKSANTLIKDFDKTLDVEYKEKASREYPDLETVKDIFEKIDMIVKLSNSMMTKVRARYRVLNRRKESGEQSGDRAILGNAIKSKGKITKRSIPVLYDTSYNLVFMPTALTEKSSMSPDFNLFAGNETTKFILPYKATDIALTLMKMFERYYESYVDLLKKLREVFSSRALNIHDIKHLKDLFKIVPIENHQSIVTQNLENLESLKMLYEDVLNGLKLEDTTVDGFLERYREYMRKHDFDEDVINSPDIMIFNTVKDSRGAQLIPREGRIVLDYDDVDDATFEDLDRLNVDDTLHLIEVPDGKNPKETINVSSPYPTKGPRKRDTAQPIEFSHENPFEHLAEEISDDDDEDSEE